MGLTCKIAWIVAIGFAITGVAVGLYFGLRTRNRNQHPNELRYGAIVSNGAPCADIGKKIIEKGGSMVDTAIAVMLCEGVVTPQSTGLGGGAVAITLTKNPKKTMTVISKERAPYAANETMFSNHTSVKGALSTAVPGELKAFEMLHEAYGKLKWEELFKPAIDLCENGFTVSPFLRTALEKNKDVIENEPTMDIFVNPKTNKIWEEGDVMYRKTLGETLRIIAKEGADAFYGGELGKKFVEDVQELGGIITLEDLKRYEADHRSALDAILLGKYKYYSTDFPSGGALIIFILNMMDELFSTDNEAITWHRLVECFKHAFGQRTLMGDRFFEAIAHEVYVNLTSKNFANEKLKLIDDTKTFNDYKFYGANYSQAEDHGTTNICVLQPNGDGISISSTINTFFGAKLRSKQTGIILNDSMDDFSSPGMNNIYGLPASPNNFIKPGKRPLTSVAPSIIIDESNNIVLLIGGAGGPKILTSMTEVILRYIYYNESLSTAITEPRLHHQLAPNYLYYERNFKNSVLEDLRKIGHMLVFDTEKEGFVSITGIGAKNFKPIPVFDSRRSGSVAYIKKKKIA